MSRQGMEAAEGLVLQHNFPCPDIGCLDEGIFQSRHRILSRDRERALKKIPCRDRVFLCHERGQRQQGALCRNRTFPCRDREMCRL